MDRLGRSARRLLDIHERLRAWGIALVSVDDGIDSTTHYGRAQLEMLAVFAEFEAAIRSASVVASSSARAT